MGGGVTDAPFESYFRLLDPQGVQSVQIEVLEKLFEMTDDAFDAAVAPAPTVQPCSVGQACRPTTVKKESRAKAGREHWPRLGRDLGPGERRPPGV